MWGWSSKVGQSDIGWSLKVDQSDVGWSLKVGQSDRVVIDSGVHQIRLMLLIYFQLSYMLLDECLKQLFPELLSTSNPLEEVLASKQL